MTSRMFIKKNIINDIKNVIKYDDKDDIKDDNKKIMAKKIINIMS